MKTRIESYKLIATNAQDAKVFYIGESLADVKRQFDAEYDITGFDACIYDDNNGAFVQHKKMGQKTYKYPISY